MVFKAERKSEIIKILKIWKYVIGSLIIASSAEINFDWLEDYHLKIVCHVFIYFKINNLW